MRAEVPSSASRDDVEHRRAWQERYNTVIAAVGSLTVGQLDELAKLIEDMQEFDSSPAAEDPINTEDSNA